MYGEGVIVKVRERLENAICCSEDGGRAMSQGIQVPLEAGKGTDTDSPLAPPEGVSPVTMAS